MMPLSTKIDVGLSNEEISSAWRLSPILSTATPSTGTLHRILHLSTREANYLLRAYLYTSKDRARSRPIL